jgi:uncharacterized protein (DUF111 family)
MRILYFDCFSGISGDMIIGALLDAGADSAVLEQELAKLGIDKEYELSWKKIIKKGIASTKFDVILKDSQQQYAQPVLQGAQSHHHHDHGHEHDEHGHHHHHDHQEHNHHHHDGSHSHDHRTYTSIVKMIQDAGFEPPVEAMAIAIFKRIGEAEAKIHGMTLEDIHFHEVGAVDSIIDIVGTAILIHHLGIDQICTSTIPVGSGKIHIDHGIFPVPAPATLEILVGIPLLETKVKGELTTPTGAGVVAALSDEFGPIPSMTVSSIGYGTGTKDFPMHPNVLRVIIGDQ